MEHSLAEPRQTRTGEVVRGTLLVADRVVTLGHARTDARALLLRGSRVVWVGDDPEQAPPHRYRQDLPGCVIGPAFVDAHAHLTPMGMSLGGLDLSQAHNGTDLLRLVRAYAQQSTSRVIWGHGLDPHRFPDRLPSPRELAEVSGGAAVYLARADGHSCLVDANTLRSAPLARAQGVNRGPDGATGVLRREANRIARRWSVGAMKRSELAEARRRAVRHAVGHGVASVHEMGGSDVMGLEDFEAWVDGDWPVKIVPFWADLDFAVPLARDLRYVGGDLYLDGTLGSHTAALTEPYADRPGHRGDLEYDDATLIQWCHSVVRAGMQGAVHAVGDAAIRQAVRCWRVVAEELGERGDADVVRRGRHRIEHADMLPLDLLDDVAELGLRVCGQPGYEARWGGPSGVYETRLGVGRADATNPYRALADRGIGVAFGSDGDAASCDPWATVYDAEFRRQPQHAVGRLEAVSMHTLGGRSAARQDRFVGVVRAGMRADLAVFEGDPYAAEDPRGHRCVATVVNGRLAHGEAPLPPAPGL